MRSVVERAYVTASLWLRWTWMTRPTLSSQCGRYYLAVHDWMEVKRKCLRPDSSGSRSGQSVSILVNLIETYGSRISQVTFFVWHFNAIMKLSPQY